MTNLHLKKAGNELSLEEIKDALKKKHACYVLITCSEPSKEGKMEVEMSYDGDESLAAYLTESAGGFFEDTSDSSTI